MSAELFPYFDTHNFIEINKELLKDFNDYWLYYYCGTCKKFFAVKDLKKSPITALPYVSNDLNFSKRDSNIFLSCEGFVIKSIIE